MAFRSRSSNLTFRPIACGRAWSALEWAHHRAHPVEPGRMTRRAPVGLLAVLAIASPLFGQGLEEVKANYTKYEFRIPMRDGKRLFTAVYVPKETSRSYPIWLNRTPYSVRPYGIDQYRSDLGPSPLFGKEGYIFA